jgi:3-polyprenyl-4-hydroxybenzoate decarboxylase
MEEFAFSAGRHAAESATKAVAWRDLREWLTLVEAAGGLQRIGASVDPIEELSAITYLAGRTPEAPALLFDRVAGDGFGTRPPT